MIAAQMCRAAFTTNFDGLVERAVAEVAGQPLTAFHLEGSRAARQALTYKKLPVTLVYSKAFAEIIQQNPNMVDSVYDFRNFM